MVGGRVKGDKTPTYWTVLDLGTEQIKALVVQSEGRENVVIGAGSAQYARHVGRMHGVPADVRAMVQGCDRALRRAEEMTERCCETPVVPDWVVVCVPNCATAAETHEVTYQRPDASGRVSERELRDVVKRAQRLALRQLGDNVSARLGSSGTKLELLETSLAAVRLDGRMVTSPLGLQGAKLTAAVFNVVVADQYLRVVKTVAERLGLEILAVASTWQALASAMPEKEGICLDVGGRATDLTLVRNGKAWSTASVPLGGREFTRELVTTFELSDADAERLKVAYSLGQLDPRVNDQVRSAMVQQLEEWAKAVDASLVELCGSDEPPRHFRLCGGSSVLPDIAEVVRSYPWTRTLDRSRHPENQPGHRAA